MFAEKFRYFAKVKSWTLPTAASRPKLSRLFFAFYFCKILTKTTQIIKNFNKCWKYTRIFENRRHLSKINSKNGQNLTKNGTNLTKIILKYSTTYQNWSTFSLLTLIKNVPKYSTFDYRLLRYIFPKLLEKPKLLPEGMGLVLTHRQGRHLPRASDF